MLFYYRLQDKMEYQGYNYKFIYSALCQSLVLQHRNQTSVYSLFTYKIPLLKNPAKPQHKNPLI